MTYAAKEQSLIEGEPIELYCFRQGTTYWTYNDSNVSIDYGGRTYESALIRRNSIEMSANSLKNLVNIEVDRTNEFVRNYILATLEEIIEFTLYRGHGLLSENYTVYWKGYVHTVKFKAEIATIVVGPMTNSLKRSGLMRKYQRTCGYALYSNRCTLNENNYKRSGTIMLIDGTKIKATVFGTEINGWFTGGKFESGNRSQMITWHEGEYVRVAHRIADLEVDDSFDAYAGCDHSASTCLSKFSNKINFGGQEFIPDKNPFVGDSIAT